MTLTSSIIQFMEIVSYLTLDGDLTKKSLFPKTQDEDMVYIIPDLKRIPFVINIL